MAGMVNFLAAWC